MSKKSRKGVRDVLARRVQRFPSPVCDSSGEVWPDEVTIIYRLIHGQKLVCSRDHIPAKRRGGYYAQSWYWVAEPKGRMDRWYPSQYDVPVMRLLGRQIIRPVSCIGGYTTKELTARAQRAFQPLTSEHVGRA